MKGKYLNYIKNLVLPTLIFGGIAGTLTGFFIILYRIAASKVISVSKQAYEIMRQDLRFVPAAVLVIAVIAYVSSGIYKRVPEIRGGGIPTSIAILRGLIRFDWLKNLIGVTVVSMMTFLVGIPLGNEGPSVQVGTAIGRGTVRAFAKKNAAWDRYVMTGGACAGFNAATNAPIAGIMFAIEEAHGRISPMIIMVAFTSVMFSSAVMKIFAPMLGLTPELFPGLEGAVRSLSAAELWIPVVMGAAMGLFAVLFLKYYKLINGIFKKKLSKVSMFVKVGVISLVTLVFGLISFSFVSTGHSLVEELIEGHLAWYFLIAILLFRMTVTLCANTAGITGGMFLPLIALGALMTSIVGTVMMQFGWIGEEYHGVVVALGICACISGMMKCPLTAVVFGVEALSCSDNILAVIVVSAISYLVTEIFDTKSINESVIKTRTTEANAGKTPVLVDGFVTVREKTFAVGKQIRDILWPSNLFVLSVKRKASADAVMDEFGEKKIREGDELHVRYTCYDQDAALEELCAIVGDQQISPTSSEDACAPAKPANAAENA